MTLPIPSEPTLSEKSRADSDDEFKSSFPKGYLVREIALRGLSQKQFAARAKIDDATLLKAIRGRKLQPQTYGKIAIALGAIAKPEIPAALAEQTA